MTNQPENRQRPLRFRWLSQRLPDSDRRRIVVVTGARQTGKTTLARRTYPGLRYVNLDAPTLRAELRSVRADAWARTIGNAVLDEAQKEPSVFEKVKFAFDDEKLRFTVLLGSSRFLLIKRIRETLAGRAFLYDLWPLTLTEIATAENENPRSILLERLLDNETNVDAVLENEATVLLGTEDDRLRRALEHLAAWGGMPALLELDDADRKQWLRSYRQTFLERDLADLVRLEDLHPFSSLQEAAMLRTAQLLNNADLARDVGISPNTARSYLEYLRASFQLFFLRPFHTNLTSTIVKAPKLYWTDIGIAREGTRNWSPMDGHLFETLVVTECHKWIRTLQPDARLYFYRTRHGAEVDLLIETPAGILGIEIKNRENIVRSDARGLKGLARNLGDKWRGGLVVSRGGTIEPLIGEHQIWSMPAHRLFGAERDALQRDATKSR